MEIPGMHFAAFAPTEKAARTASMRKFRLNCMVNKRLVVVSVDDNRAYR